MDTHRCLIITAYLPDGPELFSELPPWDYVICADGGFVHAQQAGIRPDLVIGDFDSSNFSDCTAENIMRVPVEKDDTDTMLCVKHALELGYRELIIAGGIGGRLDHTVSNLQSLAYARIHGADALLADARNRVRILAPGEHLLQPCGEKFSLFAYGGRVCGLTIRNAYYTVEQFSLDPCFPLGVSNEFLSGPAEISFSEGLLLVITSEERT